MQTDQQQVDRGFFVESISLFGWIMLAAIATFLAGLFWLGYVVTEEASKLWKQAKQGPA